MEKAFHFTKSKFMGFEPRKQHKKCASMLRHIYDLKLAGAPCEAPLNHYNELQYWLGACRLEQPDSKKISDRYHFHLQQAKVSFKEHNLLPQVTTSDRLSGQEPWPIAIYLDHIRSAHNVGSVLRTVECLRLGSVYFSNQTPPPENKQVKDASMGASEHVSHVVVENINLLPRPIIALETSQEAVSIHEYLFPQKFTLAIGNEEYGCSDALLAAADHIITIPMRGRKNSLNVANAFSMAAHEIARQRNN